MATNILTNLTQIFYDPEFKDTVVIGGDDACTNGAPSPTVLEASTATWSADGVVPGDIVRNATTGNVAFVESVGSDTAMTTSAVTDDWTADDVIQIYQAGVQGLPTYAPSFDWFKSESIAQTGLKGRARADADLTGAQWMEGTLYFDMVGFKSYDLGDSPDSTKWEPPYWARMAKTGGIELTSSGFATGTWIYEVNDDLHLDSDTVHTDGTVIPLDGYIDIDGTFQAFENAVSDITFSIDVTAGAPRMTVNTLMGNIYEDTSNNFYPFPTTDVPADFITVSDDFEAATSADSKNATLAISVLPAAGGTNVITGTCLRSWSHTLGNNPVEQRCITKEHKLDQFIITNQDANTATLVIRAADPGTFASPSAFNPEEMKTNRDMLRLSITHNVGVSLGQIQFEADYYIQTVAKAPDSAGVLEYTLTLQQANLIPALTGAQYLKITCS